MVVTMQFCKFAVEKTMVLVLIIDCITMKKFIYLLMAMLGFSCAEKDNAPHDVVAEYGCPNVMFNVKARVVDESNNPISGIEVRAEDGDPFFPHTNLSDEQGYIDAVGSFWPGTEQRKVQFVDIDGEANGGEFETLMLDVENLSQTEEGSGHWYEGAYTADMGTVTMKLKEKQTNEE